jgi:hypothetical protein
VCGVLTGLPSDPACRLISVCVRTWVLGCGAGQVCRVDDCLIRYSSARSAAVMRRLSPADRGMEERHAWTLDQVMHADESCRRDRFSRQEKCAECVRVSAYKKEQQGCVVKRLSD